MMKVTRRTTATPKEVFAVVSDGWVYPSWVVGAARMRAVDETWPSPGARLHHSFGLWPTVINDTTEVIVNEAPRRIVLQARGWPVGEARVEIRVDDVQDGAMVTILEDVTEGPGRLMPKPARQALIAVRNRETLRRLVLIAEGKAGKTPPEEFGAST
jgi:hypothetical protein